MELALYAGLLGFTAAILVPLLYGGASKFLPASVTSKANVITVIPSGAAAIAWSIAAWGVFFALALWLISLIPFAGRAVRENA
jgi:hypothetical protein